MHRWQLRGITGLVAAVVLQLGAAATAQEQDAEREPLDRPLSQEKVAELAREVDAIVSDGLSEAGVRPNRKLNDDQFLRRVYLDIAGRIPSYEEVEDFQRGSGRTRRTDLIDDLLESEGYVSHSFNYWADVLRATSNLNRASGQPYIDYIKDSLRENKPYDEFVYDMLTAEGRLHEDGAVGYFVRDDGMPLDNTANTVRIFLGTSIGCAQCHDHPFDKWSQREFFEMAAYTFGVRTRDGVPAVNRAYNEAREDDDTPREVVNALRAMQDHYRYRVRENESNIKLPHDYKYADGQPGQEVDPFTIFGDIPEEEAVNQSPRQAYARWLTGSDNPRFAKVIANRLWKRAFGVGVIEPVDEIQDNTEPFNPELIEHLTQLMIDLEFDMREFQRVVYNTETYQREASREEWRPGEEYHFPGPVLRRMTAEQVWDSFVTLAIGPALDDPPQEGDSYSGDGGLNWRSMDIENMSESEVFELAERIAAEGGRGMMMGGGGGGNAMMARASDIRSPAPAGHFLWRFGQSDRQLIDNATKDPSTTQVLTLLNGPIDRVLLQDRSYLSEAVRQADSNTEKLNVIWRSILTRRATSMERSAASREVDASGDQAFDNLVWALLNMREFLFIR